MGKKRGMIQVFDVQGNIVPCTIIEAEPNVVVQIKNHGANPQSLIPFFYSVDGVPAGISIPQDGFYTGVVGKDSCEYIQFETLGTALTGC